MSAPETAGHHAGVGRHYTGDLGDRYFAWQESSGRDGATLTRPFIAPFVGVHDRVVDFGCGGAYLLEVLPGAEKIGVEPNSAARNAAARRGLDVRPTAAAIPEEWADVVVSCHALEHTLRPSDELSELLRRLKPGGTIVLLLPVDDWRTQRRPNPADINHHLYTWTPLLIGNLLDEAGYAAITAEIITHAWPPYPTLLRRVLPARIFNGLAAATAILRRRRQIRAVARRPPHNRAD